MKNVMMIAIVLACCAVTAAVLYEPAGAQLSAYEMQVQAPQRYRAKSTPKLCAMDEADYGLWQRVRVGVSGLPKACYEAQINEYFRQ